MHDTDIWAGRAAVDGEVAVHRARQAARDIEAKPRSAAVGAAKPFEFFEHHRLLVGGNPLPLIGDPHHGAVAFAVLLWLGVQLVVSSPWLSAFVLVFLGGMIGLMLGGLVALRPDHDRYVQASRDAMAKGQTTLVVHALSSGQADQAAALLAEMGGEVTRTL